MKFSEDLAKKELNKKTQHPELTEYLHHQSYGYGLEYKAIRLYGEPS
jgi:hypothetical protein